MPINAWLSTRLAHPTPQDLLDLPDDPRLALLALHERRRVDPDGAPALRALLLARLSRTYNEAASLAAGIPYTEDDARAILASTDRHLSAVLEACHYAGEHPRALAARLGVAERTVYRRLAAARERMERWTGRPLERPTAVAA